jgi:hypothetical protein
MSKLRIKFRWTGYKVYERVFEHPDAFEDWFEPMLEKPTIESVEEMSLSADGTPRWVEKEMV